MFWWRKQNKIELTKAPEPNSVELTKGPKGEYRWTIDLKFSKKNVVETLELLAAIDKKLREHWGE